MTDTSVIAAFVDEDALLALGSDARVEVVDGEIVEMSPVGGLHHFVGGNFYDLLKPFVKQNGLGFVFMDGLIFYLERDGKKVRKARVPDVSFVRKEAVPKEWNIEKPFPGAPTLAIEVVSPDDKIEDVLKKVREYLDAGSEQVWVAYPRSREVHQYLRGESQVRTYTGEALMDVEALFPGLVVSLKDVFALPEFFIEKEG